MMEKYATILIEKLQKYRGCYQIYKIDKYEYLTNEKRFLYDQNRLKEQAKFTYSLL